MFHKLYEEDTLFGDLTSELVIPKDLAGVGRIIAREPAVVAGVQYLVENLATVGISAKGVQDGYRVSTNEEVMILNGRVKDILKAERATLNILSHLSGVATETRRMVEKLQEANSKARVAATRKTLWGYLDKLAVIAGGGDAHRWNLGDMVMIKDNHIEIVGLENAINMAKKVSFSKKIEVEVENEIDALRAAALGVDIIMLDNINPEKACKIAKKLRKFGVIIEISGGITPENINDYARCDVDIISMGHLTNSSRAVDFSMEIQALRK